MNKNENIAQEDLFYEVSILLEATLYFAGVSKANLQKAAEIYVDIVDDVIEKYDLEGVDEVLKVIEIMKKEHKELFN